ncbi:hypothetical protein KR093_009113, partial [Drosophila rubida]
YGSTIPMRIYECLREFSMLRCTKLFVLQKLEERKQLPQTGNLTRDFMDQFFGEETQLGSLIGDKYRQMSEKELNQRLVKNFQRFFKHRDIKLHFLPGMLVKIVPSKENKLKFTLKKGKLLDLSMTPSSTPCHYLITAFKTRTGRARRREEEEMQLNLMNLPSMAGAASGTSASVENYEPEAEGDSKQQGLGAVHGGDSAGSGGMLNKRKKKQSYKMTMLQVAVPILVLPIILLGSLLPFILPTLKMATILSLFMNNGAFLAAMLYAYASASATAANQPQHISYG